MPAKIRRSKKSRKTARRMSKKINSRKTTRNDLVERAFAGLPRSL